MRTAAAPLFICLMTLGACATDKSDQGVANPVTPSERFSIDVRQVPEEVKLAPHPTGLSAAQQAALGDFVRRWMFAEGGEITLQAPDHGGDPAYRMATEARDFLTAHGVASSRVRIAGYDAGGDPRAPVVVGYVRYQAKGPQCGLAWGSLAANSDNREYDNFGCSMTANIAAQVANPADLLSPRQSDPPDAQRRATVLDKYRQGNVSSTTKDDQADGTFSKVGQ